MQWEELTATDFEKAVHETEVCVIAPGVVEKHSEHLPLGTDYLVGHKIACLAAEKEAAVVFPPFYFGQIYEARCFPGTITIAPSLLAKLIMGVFDEIGRNGFKKIVVYNSHGGNYFWLPFVAQCVLWEEKSYSLYLPMRQLSPEAEKEWTALRDTDWGGHAGEVETCQVLNVRPDLVKVDRVPDEPARPLGRMDHLPPTFSAVAWYANYPDHYAGDARAATKEKAAKLIGLQADYLAQYLAAVKADEVVPTLEAEFYQRVREVGKT